MRAKIALMLGIAGLSAPAMATNLVVNGDFETGVLAPSFSVYPFQNVAGDANLPVDSVNDEGTYSIVSYDTLHPLWVDYYDHTLGNSDGHYMIVNGSDAGTGPAWAQTIAVDPNTEYILSGWFSSLYPAAIAALEWRLDGDAADSSSPSFSAPVATGVWEEQVFAFNSGANTSITFALWDTSGIASGNDYGIDDITLSKAVPAPGAIAVLGLGGAMCARRRRTR